MRRHRHQLRIVDAKPAAMPGMTSVLFRCDCLGLVASSLIPGTWSLTELLGTGTRTPEELEQAMAGSVR